MSLALRVAAVLAAFHALNAFACSTCYGASDSPLAAGMNWGIVTLLGFIGLMLLGVAAFFVFVALRASRLAAAGGALAEAAPGHGNAAAWRALSAGREAAAVPRPESRDFERAASADRGPGLAGRPDLN